MTPHRPFENTVQRVPVERLRHSLVCPRWRFDERRIALLATSVRQHGVLQPLLVRPILEFGVLSYQVVIGERRLRAALQAGVADVPVIVRELTDAEARRAWLNKQLQREGVSPLEETEAIRDLLEFELGVPWARIVNLLQRMHGEWQRKRSLEHLTSGRAGGCQVAEPVEVIAAFFAEIGKCTWQSFLTNRVPLLDYPKDLLGAMREGKLSVGAARSLARLACPAQRTAILAELRSGALRVRDLEARVNRALGRDTPSPTAFLERVRALESWLASSPVLPEGVLAEFDTLLSKLERLLV